MQNTSDMKIAIIPARGGSKRIPRKNIKPFRGKPMLAYAIHAAQQCDLFEHIVVSTDDPEIAEIAQKLGAEVPFMRDASLADDNTPTVPVIAHAILEARQLGWMVERVCCIYPAVPTISTTDIKAALTLLDQHPDHYILPVATFPSAIQRALKLDAAGRLQPFYPEYALTRTQDLEPAYHDAGQFYWARTHTWLQQKIVHTQGMGLIIPQWRVIDIDTPDDWERAERLVAACKSQGEL